MDDKQFMFLRLVLSEGKIQFSRAREDANAFVDFDLFQWLLSGHEAFISANGVINSFEPIDRIYFRLFIKTHYCHPERPRKATVLDVATDSVMCCTNRNADRDSWLSHIKTLGLK